MEDNLISILDDYFIKRGSRNGISESEFRGRIMKLGKSEDEIHAILIEMDDDWMREEFHQSGLKKAKKTMVLGTVTALCLALASVLSALGYFLKGNIQIYFFSGIAVSVFSAMKGYNDINKGRLRRVRLEMKWKSRK